MDVSRLTSIEVAELLEREKIISKKGIGVIVENEVDGDALLLLKDEDFAEIGIKLGDKVKLRRFIEKHKTSTAEQPVATGSTDHEQSVSFMWSCIIFYD